MGEDVSFTRFAVVVFSLPCLQCGRTPALCSISIQFVEFWCTYINDEQYIVAQQPDIQVPGCTLALGLHLLLLSDDRLKA